MERADIVFLQEVVPETFSYIESKLTQVFFLKSCCQGTFPVSAYLSGNENIFVHQSLYIIVPFKENFPGDMGGPSSTKNILFRHAWNEFDICLKICILK